MTGCVRNRGGRFFLFHDFLIWDLTAGQELATLQGHSAAVSS
jgi:hypothetical protein